MIDCDKYPERLKTFVGSGVAERSKAVISQSGDCWFEPRSLGALGFSIVLSINYMNYAKKGLEKSALENLRSIIRGGRARARTGARGGPETF